MTLSDENKKIFEGLRDKGFEPLWVFLRMQDAERKAIKELEEISEEEFIERGQFNRTYFKKAIEKIFGDFK